MSTRQPRIPGRRALYSDRVDLYTGFMKENGVSDNAQCLPFANRPPRSAPTTETKFHPLMNIKGGSASPSIQFATEARLRASRALGGGDELAIQQKLHTRQK